MELIKPLIQDIDLKHIRPEHIQSIIDVRRNIQFLKDCIKIHISEATNLYTKFTEVTTIIGYDKKTDNITLLLEKVANLEELLKVGETLDDVIDSYTEIVNFLDDVEDTTLNAILETFARKNQAVLSNDVRSVVVLSQAEYDALSEYDDNTEYNIV